MVFLLFSFGYGSWLLNFMLFDWFLKQAFHLLASLSTLGSLVPLLKTWFSLAKLDLTQLVIGLVLVSPVFCPLEKWRTQVSKSKINDKCV